MAKMTFWEKLTYRFGKDPLKNEGRFSPLARAIFENDSERLDFFAKHSKLNPEKLSAVATDNINTFLTLKKLQKMGARFDKIQKAKILKNTLDNILYRNGKTSFEPETLDFLRENNISLNFKNNKGKSIYDKMSNVSLWFEKATPKEIGHEFRQAVANGQIEKVKHIMQEHNQLRAQTSEENRNLINSPNSQGKTALMYAIASNNIEMARLLYEHGADVTMKDKNGNSVFASNPQMANTMMELFAKSDDLGALKIAAQAGGKFNNSNLALLAQKEETLKYLASNGTPLQDAIREASNADIRENTVGGKAAERVAILARVRTSTK